MSRLARLRRVPGACLALGVLGILGASPGLAQTPVTAVGLGYPVPAVDARSAAMGGAHLGLAGGTLSTGDPADLTLHARPSLGWSLAPEGVSVRFPDGGSGDMGRSRLSALQAVVPVADWRFGLGFSAELDQDWAVLLTDTLSTSIGEAPYTERREHNGGVSSFDLSVARRLGRVSVGAELDFLTGSLRQTFLRDFGISADDPANELGTARGESRWSYSGKRIRLGAAWQVTPSARISGLVSIADNLHAEQDSAAAETTRSLVFGLPTEVALGGSVVVTQRLLVAAEGGWAGWKGATAGLPASGSRDTWRFGVGLELAGLRLLGLDLPVRAGWRYAQLPFYRTGRDPLDESAFTFGLGTRVAGGQAAFNVGVELGSRGDLATSGVEESFRRVTISMSLLQR